MLLVVLVLAASAAAVGFARRVRRMETDRERLLKDAATALGRTPTSLDDAIHRLVAARDGARRHAALVSGAVETSASGVLVLDAELHEIFATTAAKSMLDPNRGAAEAAAGLRSLARTTLSSGDPAEERLETTVPDRRSYRAHAEPLPPGMGRGVIIRIEDVTEKERVEAMRRDFVANVSHELKTPVGALSVLAEAIVDAPDEATRERLASRMQIESARVARLVGDILDLSLVETSDRDSASIDLVDVVNEAVRATSVVASEAGSEVQVDVAESPLVVVGDRRQLVSAVANLVDNAVKYSSFRDATDRRVRVRVGCEGRTALIEVQDNGAGIAEQHQSRVFERFYRIDRGRERSQGGTGLGLAIVRHVALNHGGAVSLESSPGKGSTFRLHLPLAE